MEKTNKDYEKTKLIIKRINKLWDQSNYKLAKNSNMRTSTLNSLLNGSNLDPKLSTINKICNGLGISLKEFFDDELFN